MGETLFFFDWSPRYTVRLYYPMLSFLVSTGVKPVIWFRDARNGCFPLLVLFPAVAEREAWLPTGNMNLAAWMPQEKVTTMVGLASVLCCLSLIRGIENAPRQNP